MNRGSMVVASVVVAALTATARAEDVAMVCVELHCYCDGPDHDDTVASCDTTCEEVCGTQSSATSRAARTLRVARWSLSTVAGPAYTSRDRGGEVVPDGSTLGIVGELRFGRPLIGILVRMALASTPVVGAAVGLARERAWVFDWFDAGLEFSPRVLRGRRWSVRPTAAAWVASTALLGCAGCSGLPASGGFTYSDAYYGWGWAARIGVDAYFGAQQRYGVNAALVYSQVAVGTLAADGLDFTDNATEHAAPTLMLQVGLTSMPNGP